MLSEADRVWNRAAMEAGGGRPEQGDRALADLLLAHGMIMNGGIFHMLEALSPEELDRAIDGFRFFGLEDVAVLLLAAASTGLTAADEIYDELAGRYGDLLPNDQTIVDRFEQRFREQRIDFAPL